LDWIFIPIVYSGGVLSLGDGVVDADSKDWEKGDVLDIDGTDIIKNYYKELETGAYENSLHSVIADSAGNMVSLLRSFKPEQEYSIVTNTYSLHYWVPTNDDTYSFIYKPDADYGTMLSDLAKMTNSILWVGSDSKIYLQKRDGIEGLPIVKPISVKSKIIHKTNVFEIPSAYKVLENSKDAIVEYFNTFLLGSFYKNSAEIDRRKFDSSDYPLMLKSLELTTGNGGALKSVSYKKHTIETESEYRTDA